MNMTTRMGIRTRIGWARGLCALLLGALTAAHALASGTLVYSGTNILERWQNDGGFNSENTMTVTLSGDNFTNSASTDFIAGGQVTVSNMPYGLSPVVTRTATNTVTISLAGFANTNGPAATTNGLQFIFNDKAFSNGPASAITWASGTNLTVSFLPVASNWYVNGSSGYATQGTGANQGNGSASCNSLAHSADAHRAGFSGGVFVERGLSRIDVGREKRVEEFEYGLVLAASRPDKTGEDSESVSTSIGA